MPCPPGDGSKSGDRFIATASSNGTTLIILHSGTLQAHWWAFVASPICLRCNMEPISNKATERNEGKELSDWERVMQGCVYEVVPEDGRYEQSAVEDVFCNCNRKGCSHPPTQLILNWSCIHDCYESFLLLCDGHANDWSEAYWADQLGWTGATNCWSFHALVPAIREAFEKHWDNPKESESEFLRKHIDPLLSRPWYRSSQADQPTPNDG